MSFSNELARRRRSSCGGEETINAYHELWTGATRRQYTELRVVTEFLRFFVRSLNTVPRLHGHTHAQMYEHVTDFFSPNRHEPMEIPLIGAVHSLWEELTNVFKLVNDKELKKLHQGMECLGDADSEDVDSEDPDSEDMQCLEGADSGLEEQANLPTPTSTSNAAASLPPTLRFRDGRRARPFSILTAERSRPR